MLGSAAWTDGPDLSEDMPVTVTDLDIDPPGGVIGGEEHRVLLTSTFPPEDRIARAATVRSGARAPDD